jgi:hypothetical protein
MRRKTSLPFRKYVGGGRRLLGGLRYGSCRYDYGPPVFEQCGTACVYCSQELGDSYERWLNLSVDHVVPVGTPWKGEAAGWIEDVINCVTACRACNEFLNGYRCKILRPKTLAGFIAIRDRVFHEKFRLAGGRHAEEREGYAEWKRRVDGGKRKGRAGSLGGAHVLRS